MPVRRSSDDSAGYKVSRKVRVGVGNSNASYDDAGSKRSTVGKTQRKVRVVIEESNGDVRSVEEKKKWSKRMQTRGNNAAAAPYVDVNERLNERHGRGKRDLKMKSGNEGFEGATNGNIGHKRKRICADPGIVEDRIFDANDRKFRPKSTNNAVGSYMDKGKKVPRGKDREVRDSSRETFGKESIKFRERESNDKKIQRGKIEGAHKLKYNQDDGLGNGRTKIRDNKKVFLATQKEDLKQRKTAVGFVEKSRKKKDQGKKSLNTDSDLIKGSPKKKKRDIRIDPYDTSNKRLDDAIATSDSCQEKMNTAENTSVEMSKNALFRAIRPSPSILSYVEDNFLGRRREIEFRRAGYNTELSAPLDNIPFSTSSERERIEVPAFRNKLEFFAAAKSSSSFPPPDLPEIAFAGRSNVGKSSLLNALTRQWGIVRTSDKPGLTQTINFFNLGTKLCLVDLPGYGFAYAKDEVKEAWEELVKEYVSTRVGLKRVCLLVDTKWGMKPRDHELIDLMERSQTKYQIVLTKTDLMFPIDVARRAMQIEENLKAKKSVVQPLMMVSSTTGAGIRSLRTVLTNVARLVRR
ncbi:hypothetical protein ACS0TY_008042 [Phlomoides rotata]